MNKQKFSFIIIVLTFCYSLLMALAAVGNYINARPTTYFYLGCAIISLIIGIISFIEYKKKQM